MKNKKRNHQKRRQKASLKEARRRKSLRPKQPLSAKERLLRAMPDDQLAFWLMHGINYIVSDYDKGLWVPLIEEIYDGKQVDPEEIPRRLIAKYGGDPKNWPPEGEAAFGWSVMDRAAVLSYKKKIKEELLKKDPDCDPETLCVQPHNPIVWKVFHLINFYHRKNINRKSAVDVTREETGSIGSDE